MILQALLLFLYNVLVSANNVFPVNPAQTYPIYQQNGYTNPSANQPNDITPYLQGMLAQNQSPTPNISPSDIRQILLNRILSSPSWQTILDPSLNGYGGNLNENPNNQIASNFGSNGFGVPTEQSNVNIEDIENDAKTRKKSKHNKRKSSKSRRKNDEAEKKEKNSNKKTKTNDNNTEQVKRKNNRKSKKSSRKAKTETTTEVKEIKNEENESNKKPKTSKRKKKDDAQNKNNPIDDDNKVEDPKPRRRRKKQKTDKDKTDQKTLDENIKKSDKELTDDINLANFNDGVIEENRVPRTVKHEGNDALKLFPNMPEEVASKFMTGLPPMNNPLMSNLFSNYENIYQSMMSKNNMGMEGRVKRKKKSKNNKNKRINKKGENIKNSTEITKSLSNTKIIEMDPKIDNIVTTEKIYLNERKKTNITLNLIDEGIRSIGKPSEVNEKTIEVLNEEEFTSVTDEKIPPEPTEKETIQNLDSNNLENGYIDDYYPLFTDSAAYNANINEVYIKNLSDDKYFYATDIPNTDFINKHKFDGYSFPERVLKDYEMNKQYSDTERESIRAIKDRSREEIKEKENIRAIKDRSREEITERDNLRAIKDRSREEIKEKENIRAIKDRSREEIEERENIRAIKDRSREEIEETENIRAIKDRSREEIKERENLRAIKDRSREEIKERENLRAIKDRSREEIKERDNIQAIKDRSREEIKEKENIRAIKDRSREEIKERENIRAIKNRPREEIKFRTPPVLESPDFQTKQIDKSEIRPEVYYIDTKNDDINRFVRDKSSSYSDVKTPYYSGVKHNEIKSLKDKSFKDVETVCARSKVANYGSINKPEEKIHSYEAKSNSWADGSYFNDGEITYVIAKSIDYPDVLW